MWNLTGDNATSKPGRSLLPVLTILFVVSYGLLTMLVVEQGRTIDNQRSLIHLLFGDSVQLSSIKGKAVQKQQAEDRARVESAKEVPSAQGRAVESAGPVTRDAAVAGGREERKHQQDRKTSSTETSKGLGRPAG